MYWNNNIYTNIGGGGVVEYAWILTILFVFMLLKRKGDSRDFRLRNWWTDVNLYFHLAGKNESNGNIRTMAEFCQQIPISVDQLLHVCLIGLNRKLFKDKWIVF